MLDLEQFFQQKCQFLRCQIAVLHKKIVIFSTKCQFFKYKNIQLIAIFPTSPASQSRRGRRRRRQVVADVASTSQTSPVQLVQAQNGALFFREGTHRRQMRARKNKFFLIQFVDFQKLLYIFCHHIKIDFYYQKYEAIFGLVYYYFYYF